MADLNALIAQGVQFQKPVNPFVQYGQMQQLQQNEQANQLNQMKMQEYQRGVQEQNQLRQLNINDPDYRAKLYGISPTRGAAFDVATNEAAGKKATTGKLLQETSDMQQKSAEERLANLRFNPSNENIIAHNQDIQLSNATPEAKAYADQRSKMILGFNETDRKKFFAELGTTSANRMVAQTAREGQQATAESARLGRLTTERGQDIGAATAKAGQESVAATAKAGQGVTMRGQTLLDARERENIVIRQEDQRRKGDPAFIQKMSQATATGAAIAKDQALAQQVLPKVLETAAQTLSQIDSLIGKRDDKGNLLKDQTPHPGFQDVVGATYLPGARFIHGTSAADFQSKFDQIKGGAFLQAFEILKGGGSITNIEGEKGTSALNRMSTSTSEKEFVDAAREFQDIIRKGVERAKVRVGGGASNIDSLLEKYK